MRKLGFVIMKEVLFLKNGLMIGGGIVLLFRKSSGDDWLCIFFENWIIYGKKMLHIFCYITLLDKTP